MESNRFRSIETVMNRTPIDVKLPSNRISDFYGSHVFGKQEMQKHLSEEAYLSVMSAIEKGTKIDHKVAEQVATSMKAWALEKGATHYTHWFQPLTGSTAEKHDTFFSPSMDGNGGGLEKFSGESLVQQEPDASSLPSGGLRTTFEARGYTAWDPSSPAFIMEIGDGKTLCIPTIFVSYTGEALDFKAPLLKSQHQLEEAALKVVNLFERNVNKVTPTLGWEQEYFVVDAALYNQRPDLMMSGRTVFGHEPAKSHQLDDHYFGSIPERVYEFMLDLEKESHKLGIPLQTRHNEVAPNQFECAPAFEEVNLSVDHNQLLMDLMDRVARRHKLRVLTHEKPFAEMNGSGKHNNWSMVTDKGKNLLSPGKTPKNNLQFLSFFINTIKAVHDNADLVRASFATVGNEHRLGANEAPPAIISIFVGSHMTAILEELKKRVQPGKFDENDKDELKLDIHNKIPDLMQHNTDRNRTSPFAFTGNKFEIRTVGASANCSAPMIVLNTIVANQLRQFKKDVDAWMKDGEKKDGAILHVLRQYAQDSENILFEGDNYSEEWVKEAEKRGLSNVRDTPRALDFYVSDKTKKLFSENNVLTEAELDARHDIQLDHYSKMLQIESRVMGNLAYNHVLPVAIEYQNELISNIRGLKEIDEDEELYSAQKELVKKISHHINEVRTNAKAMVDERKKANELTDTREVAIAYSDKVKAYFEPIRYHVDKLERMVDDRLWPLPKYRELVFIR